MNPEVPRFHPFPSKTTVERSIANHEIDFPGWRSGLGGVQVEMEVESMVQVQAGKSIS